MLYYNFKNYEEFKNLFGIVKHGNNHESRKNKILLAYLKDKNLLPYTLSVNEARTKMIALTFYFE